MTTVKKLINQCDRFEDAGKFNWKPMEWIEIEEPRVYLVQFLTILASVLWIHCSFLEERIAAIRMTTQQGISHQNSNLIGQIQSNPHEIMQLNETSLTNIAVIIHTSLKKRQIHS